MDKAAVFGTADEGSTPPRRTICRGGGMVYTQDLKSCDTLVS